MKLSTKIIGINWQCNSSACLMIDGKLVGSVSEERFTTAKNDERYPLNSINWLLKEFKLKSKDINAVCYISTSWSPSPILLRHYTKFTIKDFVDEQNKYWKEKLYKKNHQSILRLFKKKIDFNQYPGKKYWSKIYNLLKNTNDHISNKKLDKIGKTVRSDVVVKHLHLDKNKIFFIDHSSGHAAWAYYSNKETNKKKFLVLTLDAFGDFINYSVFQFNNHNRAYLNVSLNNLEKSRFNIKLKKFLKKYLYFKYYLISFKQNFSHRHYFKSFKFLKKILLNFYFIFTFFKIKKK